MAQNISAMDLEKIQESLTNARLHLDEALSATGVEPSAATLRGTVRNTSCNTGCSCRAAAAKLDTGA
jgi:hypothetical protein